MTKKLLSLPPNLVNCFHDIEGVSHEEYFCTSDPIGQKLGSGGGTTWLLEACRQAEDNASTLEEWISKEKRILLHAGGQSRRLPSYAPSGKILTPIPVFRWSRGQRISQNLLELQLPLYERIMQAAPEGLHTLIASGDVYIRAGKLQSIPQADVVCYGMWVDPSLAKNHGVFLSKRDNPGKLDFMLQKPSVEQLGELMHSHLFLMDIGIWLLSDRAVKLLAEKSRKADGSMANYDLYSDFGCALGERPSRPDSLLEGLTTAILPLQDGEFYHYGTSREMISSTLSIQNLVYDQRRIMHLGVKPHPSIFIQNALCKTALTEQNSNTWIENSCVGEHWQLHGSDIITGVPENDWHVDLPQGVCLDMVPIDSARFLFNMHDAGSGIDFDLDQAVKTDNDNPVYYVQYAHARICSILKKMESEGVAFAGADKVDATLLTEPSEMDLIRMLAAFPQEIVMAAEKYDPKATPSLSIFLRIAASRAQTPPSSRPAWPSASASRTSFATC